MFCVEKLVGSSLTFFRASVSPVVVDRVVVTGIVCFPRAGLWGPLFEVYMGLLCICALLLTIVLVTGCSEQGRAS